MNYGGAWRKKLNLLTIIKNRGGARMNCGGASRKKTKSTNHN